MRSSGFLVVGSLFSSLTTALRYNSEHVGFNLNENETAVDPLDYWGEWIDHDFFPSPSNWRMPMHTFFLDRFANGDPANDDINGTQFEKDIMSNQLRYGGDLRGLQDSLDYLQGMGLKTLYIIGSPFLNMPWVSDGYSPLDLTLLDRHFGDIDTWREVIADIHQRGMYIVLDNTFATMGDLLGFEGYLNISTPFNPKEYNAVWKTGRRYHDFIQSNDELDHCDYPRFWDSGGHPVTNTTDYFVGCRDSEFDQFGEVASFGPYQEYERQLSKFAFVQDRLREWRPSVLSKIEVFSCLTIAMLDIDGFRIDKALQVTLDAQGEWSNYIRHCARRFNKDNFYIPGEIVAGNALGATYIGRGMQPEMAVDNLTQVVATTNETARTYIRDWENSALDGAAFHYSIYRAMTRFLGMDGTYAAEGDPGVNFVDSWNWILQTNDMTNANTGQFDPRHMYGVTNHDVFRWPGIENGTEKNLLGLYIITLLFPGIPSLVWGEEQALYALESTNPNYVFGRQPMTSSLAWQLHGCYIVGSVKYASFPIDAALYGCQDDNVSLDHRDPSHPVRNVIKRMFDLREIYPVLNDGYYLQQLSNQTYNIYLPGSNNTPTETGLWSVYRSGFSGLQNFTGIGQEGQSVWLLYTNENKTVDYTFDCSDKKSLVAPFDKGTVVKNLLAPYEEYDLTSGSVELGIDGSTEPNGCIQNLSMPAWGFKVLVPKEKFVSSRPVITSFDPGHDMRILSTVTTGERVPIRVEFSDEMDCDSISKGLKVSSTVEDGGSATLDNDSVHCSTVTKEATTLIGQPTSTFAFEANLINVRNGIHRISINNASSSDGKFTDAVDHFLFRIGAFKNPMIFPRTANYSDSLLLEEGGTLQVSHSAPGADLWRYTLDFGTTFSGWTNYTGGNSTLAPRVWSGTDEQDWKGQHVMVQYWTRLGGSSDHFQHGDVDSGRPPRRFPNLWLEGLFNQHGYDSGISNKLELDSDGIWKVNFMNEWPAQVSVSAWGVNPDGDPDITRIFGDIDGDHVLDRIPPVTLLTNMVNLTDTPPSPHLAYRFELNDGTFRYELIPVGSRWMQLALYFLLAVIPIFTATFAVFVFVKSFYQVKFNEYGPAEATTYLPMGLAHRLQRDHGSASVHKTSLLEKIKGAIVFSRPVSRGASPSATPLPMAERNSTYLEDGLEGDALQADAGASDRRCVLIATMEYDIEDWSIKIKIGGLGVMAQLMSKNLGHQDLIWVVPCVGDVDYPLVEGEVAEPMHIVVLEETYQIQVRVHILRNITYVLLDAPVFRQQSKSEPYPPRMDDLSSAIYYSAWNSCIAEAIRRFKPDIYHINDYHGAVAPIHLLPDTIPCALSLHNAEFQGLWPMRTKDERDEVCKVYNLDADVVHTYVQFGEVFNLLHAGVSYLRIHQKGFGAVGVSKKYGKRSWTRYPIFWGLKSIGALPNPDPSDLAAFNPADAKEALSNARVDSQLESERGALRVQAQKWAGLNVDPKAELFVFVGRWSMQKGVDLIADIFPAILEKHPDSQLIAVGPVIDLFGKFAALKLAKMMEVYPGRVCSKPEFTQLPPYIFSGAEFALIPSRDEPFGLVAVEFGRKGALGVGARVGGLGSMPGWWYTIESTSTKHLLHQFKEAIETALESNHDLRALLRARSGRQRFPVVQWVEDLQILQSTAIKKHGKHATRTRKFTLLHGAGGDSGASTPNNRRSAATSRVQSTRNSRVPSRAPSPSGRPDSSPGLPQHALQILQGMGRREGPGHVPERLRDSSGNPYSDMSRDLDSEAYSEDEDLELPQATSRPSSTDRPEVNLAALYGSGSPEEQSPRLAQSHNHRISLPIPAASTPPLQSSQRNSTISLPHNSQQQESHSLLGPRPAFASNRNSMLSLASVVGDKTDFELQKTNPFFTDPKQDYSRAFEKKLADLNAKNSYDTCIEDFIEKSEKDWFNRFREVKLGKSSTPASSVFRFKDDSPPGSIFHGSHLGVENGDDQFLLERDYQPPTGVKKFLLRRIGDWPIYSLLLAFGQIIAANSYQVTLLVGQVGQPASKLYAVATIYLITSIAWWFVYRKFKAIYALSVPFVFYGLAFLLIGLAPFAGSSTGKGWVQNIATGCYATASSSGALFFALNFGDQGGAPVTSWVFRACVIQGTQQIYISGLWWWGSTLAKLSNRGVKASSLVTTKPAVVTSIGVSIAVLMWAVGAILFIGLPNYYRQSPGKVPSFLAGLIRRKIVLWFFMMVVIQNFFLSAPYGRNWLYLWSSQHMPTWGIGVMVVFFFIGVWAAFLYMFNILTKQHSWILSLFAIGLGAPRWCQILWATSNIGLYLPWAGSAVGSAIAGRTLWLWLGVLDSIQGVGFGMILLHTLTRFHIIFTLIAAQVLGSIATIAARGFSPNRLGPGPIFPDFSAGVSDGLSNGWFWVGLLSQLSINVVALFFFRKEQLNKP